MLKVVTASSRSRLTHLASPRLLRPAAAPPSSARSSGSSSPNLGQRDFPLTGYVTPRLEDHATVLAVPWTGRPLFPSMITSVNVQKPAYREILESRAPYVGVFLLKDEPSTDLKSEKSTGCLTGKDLFNRLHQVGTLAGIVDDNGGDMIAGHVLVGHGRLRITEMVSEDPLIVKVDHLKDKPYSKADGPNLPTALDLLSTISMNRVPFIELIRRLDFSRLADHGAAISNGANYLQLQEVLAELNVHKRLKLALDLVKEQTDFTRLESQMRLVLSKIGTRMALEESGLEDLGSHSVVKVLTATDTPTKWSRLLDWISDLLSI